MRMTRDYLDSVPRVVRLTFFILLCCLALAASSISAAPLPLVSRLNPGQPPPAGGHGDSCLPVLSPDGRVVLFASTANNLLTASNGLPIPALVPARFNVFLRDRNTQATVLVSQNLSGVGGGNGDSIPVAISTNGQFALFESSASDLVAGDTNNATDLFVRNLAAGTTHLVSASLSGLPGNGASRSGVMTPDGHYVAFVSEASNLVDSDTNAIADVFRRDLWRGTTAMVSVGARTTNAAAVVPASSSESPEITPNGRFVAFTSTATNLVPTVRTVGEVYLRDLVAGTTTWASSGMRAALQSVTGKTNAVGFNLALSADAQYLAYQACLTPLPASTFSGVILRYNTATGLTDLVHTNATVAIARPDETRNLDLPPDGRFLAFTANSNGVGGITSCILVWDASTGVATLASGDAGGGVATGSLSSRPALTPDGRQVVFISNASLATNSVAGAWQLYRRDLLTGTTLLLNVGTNGVPSPVPTATVARISDDGAIVAFEAADGSLVANDSNHSLDVFVRDIVPATNELISSCLPALGGNSPNGPSQIASFSASSDGRYVAYSSEADNLVGGDTNAFRDIFVRDLATATNWLISVGPGGGGANGTSYEPSISGDGRYVAYTSSATNLVAGDANKATDVLVCDRETGITSLASVKSTGAGTANKASYSPSLSSDGRWLLFRSQATDLVAGSFSGADNLFLRDLQNGATRALTTTGAGATASTPDGRSIGFVGGANSASTSPFLYVWDAALAARVYTNATLGITNLAVSSDGNRLAYVLSSTLQVADRALRTNWTLTTLPPNSRTQPRLNSDGNWLTHARVSGSYNQIFLDNLHDGSEWLLSHATNSSAAANGHSDQPEISPDGRFVAYRSQATNLLAGLSGTTRQIVLYDRLTGANSLVSANPATSEAGSGFSMRAGFSPDGQVLLLQSWSPELASGDFNRTGDVLAYSFATAVLLPAAPGQSPWISWPALFGNQYRVEFKHDLSDPVWQVLPGSSTNLGLHAFQQDLAASGVRRFYRVQAY